METTQKPLSTFESYAT